MTSDGPELIRDGQDHVMDALNYVTNFQYSFVSPTDELSISAKVEESV